MGHFRLHGYPCEYNDRNLNFEIFVNKVEVELYAAAHVWDL